LNATLLLTFIFFLSLNAQSIQLEIFENDGLFGYKSQNEKVVIEAKYVAALDFSDKGIAFVADSSGWVCIDKKGKSLLQPFIYDNGPDYFSEGLARFVEKGKVGFFDESGNIIIKAQWDFAYPFEDGKAAVCNGCKMATENEHQKISGGEWGYINKTGKVITPIGSVEADSVIFKPKEVELLKM
jgi:hypothetical protein